MLSGQYLPEVYSGYFDFGFLPAIQEKHSSYPEAVQEILKQITQEISSLRRLYMLKVLGKCIYDHEGLNIDVFLSKAQTMTDQEKSHFYAEAFSDISLLIPSNIPYKDIPRLELGAQWFSFAVGYYLQEPAWESWKISLDPLLKTWVYRGAGSRRSKDWLFGRVIDAKDFAVIPSEIPAEFETEYFWGFGWGAADYFPYAEKAFQLEKFLRKLGLKEELVIKALEGFESYRRWQEGLISHPLK